MYNTNTISLYNTLIEIIKLIVTRKFDLRVCQYSTSSNNIKGHNLHILLDSITTKKTVYTHPPITNITKSHIVPLHFLSPIYCL